MKKLVEIKYLDLLKYLVPERLDIVVKYLYIDAYTTGNNYDYYKDLYLKHILLRTGGFEDEKKSANDYLESFNNLIENIKSRGFDKDYPIPVSSFNNIILNGAHRLAVCLYFKKNAWLDIQQKPGVTWDFEWFKRNNFEDSLNSILCKYIELKINNTFIGILWHPAYQYKAKVTELLSQNARIVSETEYVFDEISFPSVIEDIYSYEFGVYPSDNIRKKINTLMRYPHKFSLFLIHIDDPVYENKNNLKVCIQVSELKTIVRNKLKDVVEIDKYITMHTTDNPEHTRHITNIVFNKLNLESLKYRTFNYRVEFLDWIKEFQDVIESYNINKDDCCIVGSSTMEIYGIRNSTDIDFVLLENVRDKHFSDEFKLLSENVDIVSKGYHERSNTSCKFKDDQIICDYDKHIVFRGFKFVSLNLIRDRKVAQKREKDLNDVLLIDKFIASNYEIDLTSNIIKAKKYVLNKLNIYFMLYFKYGILYKIKVGISKHFSEEQKNRIKSILKKKQSRR